MNIREQVSDWVKNNGNRWKTATYAEIAEELDMQQSAVYHYLPDAVSRVLNPEYDPNGVLPSGVRIERTEALKNSHKEIVLNHIREHPDIPDIDIADLCDCSPSSVIPIRETMVG